MLRKPPITLGCLALFASVGVAQEAPTANEVRAALCRAVGYYHGKVARHGGYVYYTSLDLADRWGEGRADANTIFVEPPGTPAVGLALVAAYSATGDPAILKAARDAGDAMVYGQLQSGGWTQTIHFGPAKRLGKYRNGKGGSWNASSLDDEQTQASLQFLLRLDQALEFRDAKVHEAVEYGLAALLKAQFPSGGFPQVWTGPTERKPVLKARVPDYDWKTERKVRSYWDHATLNDGLAGTTAATLIVAHEITRDVRYRDALAKLGDFLILAQMPPPQPGWCQQYGDDMFPIWARKFEPPAISGWESQDAMETLVRIARVTGDAKYLAPVEPALAYFRAKCLAADGTVARFYEFGSNRPLYMDGAYRLTYDPSAAPTHYGWRQPARFDRIDAMLASAKRGDPAAKPRAPSANEVRRILADLDAEGRWISTYAGERLRGQPKFSPGFRYLSSAVFAKNIETLSAYFK